MFSSFFFRVRLDALSETGVDCKLLQTYLKTQNCHVVITECSEEKTSLKRKKEQENQRESFNRYSKVYFQILSKTKPIKNRSFLDPIKNPRFCQRKSVQSIFILRLQLNWFAQNGEHQVFKNCFGI